MSGRNLRGYQGVHERERGVVLIAVLMFIAVILPVTLLILDSVRIESLLPVNEAYMKTAGDEADKGFDEAVSAIMEDQDWYYVDVTRDINDPNQNYWLNPYFRNTSAKHEIDYLAERWARHPENDTVFLVERSLENIAHPENTDADPDEDKHSVPVRWQLMDVPFGMDDFGEFYMDPGDYPRILLPFEYVGVNVNLSPQEANAPAFYIDPSDFSMLAGPQNDGADPVSKFAYNDMIRYWRLPPTDPNYYLNINNLTSIVQFKPRPASYFRNTSGEPSVSLGSAGLPADESGFNSGFMRENQDAVDRFVFDSLFDFNSATNQYPTFMPLQQAVTESLWANAFFGSTGASNAVTQMFVSSNKEYKPAPGTLTKYQLGAQEGDAVPGWHETIVSDESGRFPINQLLNVIFSSHNLDYTDGNFPEVPTVRRDQFDVDIDNLINDEDHPNHSGFLLARDMLVSLLLPDGVMAQLASNWDGARYDSYQAKATWMIRQMLTRRNQLDEASDFNRNGDLFDDESAGEIFQFPERTGNNDSATLSIPPPGNDILDGSGRMGDAQDLWDGTWRVYTNPKELLTEFRVENPLPAGVSRLSTRDFELLNQRVTLYSMDTEYCADPDHPAIGGPEPRRDLRYNINRMQPRDDINTAEDESALYNFLLPIIGKARLQSIMNWRDGLVDLNGDGDLNDEYIEQPVSDERYDPVNKTYADAASASISTITYREREHPNFQDPTLEACYVDPDYFNIRNLGDLITIPMSTNENLIAYSEASNTTDDPTLIIRQENQASAGDPPKATLSNRSLYPDFTIAGSGIAYDNSANIYRNNNVLTSEVLVANNRKHPSWGPGDGLMSYYLNDRLYVRNMVNDVESLVLNNANLPPDIADFATGPVPFWNLWNIENFIGNAEFEMASPDISPSGSNNEIVFTQVAPGSTGETFLDPQVAYNLAVVKLDGSLLDLVTDNEPGTYDYAPDFTSSGDMIIFTRTSYAPFEILRPFIGELNPPVPVTSLWMVDRNGTMEVPLQSFWDIQILPLDPNPGMIQIDFSAFPVITITLHQAMFPSISADDQRIVFMDCPVTFRLNWTDPEPKPLTPVSASGADIYSMSLDFFQDWSNMTKVVDAADAGEYEIFPDIGRGDVFPARQANTAIGDVPGYAIDLSNAKTATNEPFSADDRRLIAMDIDEASLALRESIGWGADDQNWLLKDLPSVPEHTVNVLRKIADVVSFRDPVVTYDPAYKLPDPIPFPPPPIPEAPIQAYPGRVNINTASRPVLRTVFLHMFQGPENDPDDDNDPNVPQPKMRGSGGGSVPLNLLDPDLGDRERFIALMIADRYAHQVVEYRKWIYNNQGSLGVTDETVPSNLPLYERAYPGTSHYGNYRANPFYPFVDTDGDGFGEEVPRYNPEPPFRSIADLFKVLLFDATAFTEDWTYDGIGGTGGPDMSDLPRSLDPDGNVGAGNQETYLRVWGPIYNTDRERICTHPTGSFDLGSDCTLYGFASTVDNDFDDVDNYNDFYEHQRFRLFSADDFKRIASFLTVRTYNYRIESRGVVRVSTGRQRTDVNRDKIWIITTNNEAYFGQRLDPVWDITKPLDSCFIAQNRGDELWYTLFFEETPQSGLALTRSSFLPD